MSNRSKNRRKRIYAQHKIAIVRKPSVSYKDMASKSGFTANQGTLSSSAKKERPIGKDFATVVTKVYRHKLKTDKKAKY